MAIFRTKQPLLELGFDIDGTCLWRDREPVDYRTLPLSEETTRLLAALCAWYADRKGAGSHRRPAVPLSPGCDEAWFFAQAERAYARLIVELEGLYIVKKQLPWL